MFVKIIFSNKFDLFCTTAISKIILTEIIYKSSSKWQAAKLGLRNIDLLITMGGTQELKYRCRIKN